MTQVQAPQRLAGDLPAGFKLSITADTEDARGTMRRFRGTELVKTSPLVADPVPYVFGPFAFPVAVSLECAAGAYSATLENVSAPGTPTPELTVS